MERVAGAVAGVLVALAAACVVAVCAAAAPSTESGAVTGHFAFDLLHFTPTGFVDNPPRKGLNHLSPGDVVTAASTIYDTTGKHRLGRTSELCTATVAAPVTLDCSFALIFADGSELLVHGAINPTSTPWRAPIVGGYGTYAGARGWVRETNLRGGERMTGVLMP
jgi:hypothetical protein